MLVRILTALLNGVLTFVVLLIIAAILGKVGVADIGAIIAQWAWAISVLVGALTFFGAIPNYWKNPVN